ncbi:hypothetical protein BKA70DRAFT_1280105 [Coprinopsis sp. MPI-PUGE-AT-0042]|nr:hypothetical protein BKA70DRAFT_1280105 [Coprinopsis sp. MPI-PUGE-AT-0042]
MRGEDENGSSLPGPPPTNFSRHAVFYSDVVTIRVESMLFRVPINALCRASEVFEGMFLVDRGDQGHTDDNPILLEGFLSNDFESLLRIIFPQSVFTDFPDSPSLSKEEWEGVLKLSTVWEMDKIRTMAVERLSSMQLGPLEKIKLAKDYRVPLWLSEGIETLAAEFEKHSIDDISLTLGWEKAARFANVIAREQIQQNDVVHKSRILCYQCKSVLGSAKRVHCSCETRWAGEFCFTLKSIDAQGGRPDGAQTATLDAVRGIFTDELEGM